MDPLTRQQVKAARALLDWTAAALAEAAGVPVDTIRSFESGRTGTLSRGNEAAVRKALGEAGVQLLASGEVAAGPGVAMEGSRDE